MLWAFGNLKAWQPDIHQLFANEHGDIGFDELNQITRSGNYGWPNAAGPSLSKRYQQPLIAWEYGIAPSGLAIYRNQPHPWHGNLFVAGLKSQQIRGKNAQCNQNPVCVQQLIVDRLGRIRAVAMVPDGYLYITTSNRDDQLYSH